MAQRLIQTRGFQGFSYRDLADEIQISTASIHYHFPTKADLGVALVQRFRAGLIDALSKIEAKHEGLAARLDATARLFVNILHDGERICVSGALAGEFGALPAPVQAELRRLIADAEAVLGRFLAVGKRRDELRAGADPAVLAQLWFGALQGNLIVARAAGADTLAATMRLLRQMTLAAG